MLPKTNHLTVTNRTATATGVERQSSQDELFELASLEKEAGKRPPGKSKPLKRDQGELVLFTFKEASEWASEYLGKNVTSSNISYLVQYGRIPKHGANGGARVSKDDLVTYYMSYNGRREISWKKQLGSDLNWALSFDEYKEAETTKHVHRLHPYKGKFIPQLVQYFLDNHTDTFKREVYFKEGDIILDPFCGSGTTLVQSAELGLHAVGIDVSAFNALISNVKIGKHNLSKLQVSINDITRSLKKFLTNSRTIDFEARLLEELYKFNSVHFPSPEYKYRLKRKEVDEDRYGAEKERQFLPIFKKLVKTYGVKPRQDSTETFLDKWYAEHIRNEIDHVFQQITRVEDDATRNILSIILSRTVRSCRATTHSDLATLLEPITTTYYCSKHGKICKPLFSILKWWQTYSVDTLDRLAKYDRLRTPTFQFCITGDSRSLDIVQKLKDLNPQLSSLVKKRGIAGIFSSPPYVGLINYHEQHAYAYDLFRFQRRDELEIGPLYSGQGKVARESYVQGIADVLKNCKVFFAEDFNVFLVANDKFNLYPIIAERSGMTIVNQFKRPVLNRTERDKSAYSETIFHLRAK